MVLPLLGGAPSVWSAAMVFYQTALLAGYAYAHGTTAWLGVRRQAVLHLVVLSLPLLVLPISVPAGWTPPTESNPIPWLLAVLTMAVGLPLFVVSASAPLLQRWFAATGHPAAADPYFLYGASNLGSMLALLAYPTWVEPSLRLADQSRLWTAGYAAFAVLTVACAIGVWRSRGREDAPGFFLPPAPADTAIVGVGRRLRWMALAAVPVSLMLSLTTYLSTDIAAFPLLWVVPLAIYLLTYMLAFARRSRAPSPLLVSAFPVAAITLAVLLAANETEPIAIVMPLHVLAFFLISAALHGELARARPHIAHLTEFYLWISFGGVLGGVSTALLAPRVFTSVREYPVALVLACLLAPFASRTENRWSARALDVTLPAAVGLLMAAALTARRGGVLSGLSPLLTFGLPAIVIVSFGRSPLRLALGASAMLLMGGLDPGAGERTLHVERSFFGVHRVEVDASSRFHTLYQGTTVHGMQSLDPSRRGEALTYYHRTGPIGQVLGAVLVGESKPSVAVVGLGTGSVACLGNPGQVWVFYEIDPAVLRIARDPQYFTLLRDCPPEVRVVLGDARLSLKEAPDGAYAVMILDAYSSDAVPVHLLTREALDLYLAKLAPTGVLAFHVSNTNLDLEPILAGLARRAHLTCLVQDEGSLSSADTAAGKYESTWVVMARDPAHLGELTSDPRWKKARQIPDQRIWTDDYSSVWSTLRPWHNGATRQP